MNWFWVGFGVNQAVWCVLYFQLQGKYARLLRAVVLRRIENLS